jgi:ketosteroid isomerase-like protein
MATRDAAEAWLDRYVEAWRTYDKEKIGALFSEDAEYFFQPFDEEPVRGRDAIVANWLEEPDAPGSWEARYAPLAVDGDVVVAEGRTTYRDPDGAVTRQFANHFVLRFDAAGRCTHFTEWFMQPRRA